MGSYRRGKSRPGPADLGPQKARPPVKGAFVDVTAPPPFAATARISTLFGHCQRRLHGGALKNRPPGLPSTADAGACSWINRVNSDSTSMQAPPRTEEKNVSSARLGPGNHSDFSIDRGTNRDLFAGRPRSPLREDLFLARINLWRTFSLPGPAIRTEYIGRTFSPERDQTPRSWDRVKRSSSEAPAEDFSVCMSRIFRPGKELSRS